MRATTIELSHEEYRTAWHALGLGLRHWNLDLPGLPVMTEEQRRIRTGRLFDALRARGLADRHGLAPALEDALHLLAGPSQEVHGWVLGQEDQDSPAGQEGPVRLLAGSRGGAGVLALLDAQRLVIRTGPASSLCTAVAGLLPGRPAGPGSSVSVPSELLARPAGEGEPGLTGKQLEKRLLRGGVKPAAARAFVAMVGGSRRGGGKFGATRRDRAGARKAASGVLAYLATERGGYTLQPLRGPDGSAWTTLAPATIAQLAQRIAQLIDGTPHN